MKVAVIGSFLSKDYPKQLALVKLRYPEEEVLDCGRYHDVKYDKCIKKMFRDLEEAHVVVCTTVDFKSDHAIECRLALKQSLEVLNKDVLQLDSEGRIVPFNSNYDW